MMKRLTICMMLLALPSASLARGEGPYYGPMKRWHGIGYKFGYEDRVEADGTWRIDAAVHGRDGALDMAMYRAAERARDAGYRYIFLLGGKGSRLPGIDSATLYARPSDKPGPPVGCRSKRPSTCYTADVAVLLRMLGGPGGTQPGVAVAAHRDRYGRAVIVSGYGIGAVGESTAAGTDDATGQRHGADLATMASARQLPFMPPPSVGARTPVARPGGDRHFTTDARLKHALKDAQPIGGRDPKQGWTISD